MESFSGGRKAATCSLAAWALASGARGGGGGPRPGAPSEQVRPARFFLVISSWLHRETIRGDVVLGRRRGTPSARISRGPMGGAGERPRPSPALAAAAGRNHLSTHFYLARCWPISAPTGVGTLGVRNEKSLEWRCILAYSENRDTRSACATKNRTSGPILWPMIPSRPAVAPRGVGFATPLIAEFGSTCNRHPVPPAVCRWRSVRRPRATRGRSARANRPLANGRAADRR